MSFLCEHHPFVWETYACHEIQGFSLQYCISICSAQLGCIVSSILWCVYNIILVEDPGLLMHALFGWFCVGVSVHVHLFLRALSM